MEHPHPFGTILIDVYGTQLKIPSRVATAGKGANNSQLVYGYISAHFLRKNTRGRNGERRWHSPHSLHHDKWLCRLHVPHIDRRAWSYNTHIGAFDVPPRSKHGSTGQFRINSNNPRQKMTLRLHSRHRDRLSTRTPSSTYIRRVKNSVRRELLHYVVRTKADVVYCYHSYLKNSATCTINSGYVLYMEGVGIEKPFP